MLRTTYCTSPSVLVVFTCKLVSRSSGWCRLCWRGLGGGGRVLGLPKEPLQLIPESRESERRERQDPTTQYYEKWMVEKQSMTQIDNMYFDVESSSNRPKKINRSTFNFDVETTWIRYAISHCSWGLWVTCSLFEDATRANYYKPRAPLYGIFLFITARFLIQ